MKGVIIHNQDDIMWRNDYVNSVLATREHTLEVLIQSQDLTWPLLPPSAGA